MTPSMPRTSPGQPEQGRDWLTTAEAATRIGVAHRRVNKMLAAGALSGHLTPLGWMIDAGSVDIYLAEHGHGTRDWHRKLAEQPS